MITDWFPKRNRGIAIAIYTSGLYFGGGISLYIGALVVKGWNARYAVEAAPMGLAGWQAAFLAVGLPGLLLALWVATLREPVRGQADGLIAPVEPHPFRVFFQEICMVLPPLTLWSAFKQGPSTAVRNVLVAGVIALAAWGLILLTGSKSQWIVMAIGIYAVFSWASTLKHRDPVAFELIWGTPAFLCIVIGYGLISFNAYAVSAFAPTYAVEHFKATAEQAGFIIGGSAALGGVIGVIGGGWISDQLRKINPAGRVIMILVGAVLSIIPFAVAFTTENLTVFYALFLPMTILSSATLAPSGASIVDLVLPRMRGTATAAFFIGTTLVGLALGPYMAGYVSKVTQSLATGLLSLLVVVPISLTALVIAYRILPKAEETMIGRARAAGEAI
jgi:MFS family permease